MSLGLGLGLGLSRVRGGGFDPLTLDGTVFLIDCKASAQQEYIREVEGEPAFWTKLLNLAAPMNSAEYIAEADQAIYQPDGGFGWHEAHQNALASTIYFRTLIIAIQNNNPEYQSTATAIMSSEKQYVLAMKSTYPDLYATGCGLYQGTYQQSRITTNEILGDGAKKVISLRNQASNGAIRYNGIAQTLRATGTDDSLYFNGLPTSNIDNTNYRWRGTIYGIYCNSNPMSDADIAKVEAWMRARYNI